MILMKELLDLLLVVGVLGKMLVLLRIMLLEDVGG